MAEESKIATAATDAAKMSDDQIEFRTFENEADLQTIISMISLELSEPYPIYTYRYFVQKWPHLTYLAYKRDDPERKCIGCIVSKLDDQFKPND